jgi:PhzF family phenazine biosynthesis protein
MKIKIFQIDAFTNKVFGGNPAAICPLDNWLNDTVLQHIAMENNLAETGFYVKQGNVFEIRWFTPMVEVDLCGHATLAAAFVIFNLENYTGNEIEFYSPRSGVLKVVRQNDWLTLNFPTDIFKRVTITDNLIAGFNNKPVEAYKGKTDYMLVFSNQEAIETLIPDLTLVNNITDCRGVITTAKGKEVDFVSRFFAPQSGISEDPVTGSAHTTLTPYWSEKLSKKELTAMQLSERKGYLKCNFKGERTEISGKAVLFLKGEIEIN